jgi:hypothetical protein
MQKFLQLIEYILCCFWKYRQRRNFTDNIGTLMKWYRRESKERTGDSGKSLLKLEKTLLIQTKEHSRLEYKMGKRMRIMEIEIWDYVWFNSVCVLS